MDESDPLPNSETMTPEPPSAAPLADAVPPPVSAPTTPSGAGSASSVTSGAAIAPRTDWPPPPPGIPTAPREPPPQPSPPAPAPADVTLPSTTTSAPTVAGLAGLGTGVPTSGRRPRRSLRLARAAVLLVVVAAAATLVVFLVTRTTAGSPSGALVSALDSGAAKFLRAELTTTTTTLAPPQIPVPVVYRIETTDPVVFLTIDDGWAANPAVIDVVTARKAPITAFLLTTPAKRDIEYFRKVTAFGGDVESHTMNHQQLTKLPPPGQHAQICGNADVLTALLGQHPLLFRPPYGSFNNETNTIIGQCGMYANVMWSVSVNKGRIAHRFPGQALKPGDIILFHFRPELPSDLNAVFAELDRLGLRPAPLLDYLGPKAKPPNTKPAASPAPAATAPAVPTNE